MKAQRDKKVYDQISKGLSAKKDEIIIIDRFKISFNYCTKMVTITKSYDQVLGACKIGGCRMPYEVMQRLIDNDFDENDALDGFEWL